MVKQKILLLIVYFGFSFGIKFEDIGDRLYESYSNAFGVQEIQEFLQPSHFTPKTPNNLVTRGELYRNTLRNTTEGII